MKKYLSQPLVCLLIATGLVIFFSETAWAAHSADHREIIAGTLENNPPQFYTDPKTGQQTGFDVDILNALSRLSHLKIRFKVFSSWSALEDAAANGKIDMIPSVGISENKLADYLFTVPYRTVHAHIFVRSTSTDINGINNLADKTIGIVAGNVGIEAIHNHTYRNVRTFNRLETALFDLLSGSIDALIYPDTALQQFARQSGLQDKIRKVGPPLLEVKIGIAVIKEKADFYVRLNTALKALLTSEEYHSIYEKWYQSPEPYWNVKRVTYVMGFLLGLVVIALIIWRFFSIWRLNTRLKQSIKKRESVELALRESEQRFRQMAEVIREVFWISSPDWKEIEYISPTYEEVWGRSCQSLYTDPLSWTAAIEEEDLPRVNRYMQEKSTEDYSELVFPRYRVRRPDGSVRWISARGFPVRNEQGEIYRIAGIAEDITAIKQAEDELKDREEQVRLLLNYTGEAIYGVDLNGDCIFANPACVKLLGYQSDTALLHRNMHGIIHSRKTDATPLPEHECQIYQAMRSGKMTSSSDEVFWRADGSSFPISYTSSPILRNGKIVGAVITFIDITDRLRREKELKQAKDDLEIRVAERTEEITRLLGVVEQSPNIVVITDYEGIIKYVNPKFYSVYGYTQEEVIGQKTSILQADNVDRKGFSELWSTIKAGKEWRGEFHNLKKTGERTWQLVTISPVFNASNEITHFIASQENIDQEKEANLKLERAMVEAEKANRAKSTFLASMSHELRTPLNAIIGFTQILKRQGKDILNDRQKVFLDRIWEAGDHLLQMVNDILDLSKVEADKFELDLKPFNLGAVLARSPLTIQSIAQKKNISIETNIPQNLGWIIADETRIKQVMYNFLSNAFKFTENGKKIGMSARTEKNVFYITIWDEGIGINEENLGLIFEPFEQIHNSTNKEGGTGLGLAISKKLVEMHQGRIEVISKPGKGSRFTIILLGRIDNPNLVESRENKGSDVNPVSSVAGKKILVVEDSDPNRQLIEVALAEEGYRLDFASTGEEAVMLANQVEYDLVLMDIQLPGISGLDAMKQIRANGQPATPFIAVTAYAMKGDRQQYLDAGFNSYISKPIFVDHLIQEIQKTLNG